MKKFIWLVKQFGLKIALDSYVLDFTKWFLGAKRIHITYYGKHEKTIKKGTD